VKGYSLALRKHLADIFTKVSLINDHPIKIAKGAAIGVFWGVLPTFGFAILFAIPTAFLFRANKVASISTTFVSNPLTTPFFYTMSLSLGTLLLNPGLDTEIFLADVSSPDLADLTVIGVYFFFGGFILAAAAAVIAYLTAYYFLIFRKKGRAAR